jgi:hypothetical protein
MSVPDRALVVINIVLILYCGNVSSKRSVPKLSMAKIIFKDTNVSTSIPHILLR